MTDREDKPVTAWNSRDIDAYCAETAESVGAETERQMGRIIEIDIDFEPLEERNARILSRYSVFDLREQSEDDLDAGIQKLLKTDDLSILSKGVSDNCISWWKIRSGNKIYEVRRFFNFCFCSCADFFFSQKDEKKISVCKHLSLTTAPLCIHCKKRPSGKHGEKCQICEIRTAPYLKQSSMKPVTKIAGIRI